ncbi:MAG: alkaline phosphatase family protein [Alistipes sp.]|nr:alkaline phosphatase family protein [Candidatus Alistipes equi]
MKRAFTYLVFLLIISGVYAGPKLAVNIVISGMRAEEMDRFSQNFQQSGFRRVMEGGLQYKECYLDFAPTLTTTALVSLLSGCDPSAHEIVSQTWYLRTTNIPQTLFHAQQGQTKGRKALANGISDLYSNNEFVAQTLSDIVMQSAGGDVTSIALDPLSAISMAGKTRNCFWLAQNGTWESAECFSKELPSWVTAYNAVGFNKLYALGMWFSKFETKKYFNHTISTVKMRDTDSDAKVVKQTKQNRNWVDELLYTPAGNAATIDFAKKAIEEMLSSKDKGVKMLNLCLDTSRHIIERYGNHSIEYEDMIYDLDERIAEFLSFLDQKVGLDKYVLTLTSDHGSSPSMEGKLAEHFDTSKASIILNAFLSAQHGQDDWILGINSGSVYFNRNTIYNHKLSLETIQNEVAAYMLQLRGVSYTIPATSMLSGTFLKGPARILQNGYSQVRSGDVLYALRSGVLESDGALSASGSIYIYDRHVPLLLYGTGCKPSKISRRVYTTMIAPTLSYILALEYPSSSEAISLEEIK